MLVRLAECATAGGDPGDALDLLAQAELRLHSAPDPFVEVGVRRARAEALVAPIACPRRSPTPRRRSNWPRRVGAAYEEARSLAVRARPLAGLSPRPARRTPWPPPHCSPRSV